MFYFTLGEFENNDTEENTTEATTEATTEIQTASSNDAWSNEKVDNIISYTYGSFVLTFFIVIYLLHDMLHKILIRNTNEIR